MPPSAVARLKKLERNGRSARLIQVIPSLFLGLTASYAMAQETYYYQEMAQKIKAPEAELKAGVDLFGDQVNLFTGGLSFKNTDVSLRGNNALAVAVGRTLNVGSRVPGARAFGRWDIDIPRMHGTFSAVEGWVNGAGDRQRCSNFSAPRQVMGNSASYWNGYEFWSGTFLSIPGEGDKRVLRRAADFTTAPGGAASYPLVTSDHWTFQCLPALANGTAATQGEGFVAISPDGTRYKFDWLLTYKAKRLSRAGQDPGGIAAAGEPAATDAATTTVEPDADGQPAESTTSATKPAPVNPAPTNLNPSLDRIEAWLVPTVVTDRHGNTVTYTYDPAQPNNLTRIASSDGRIVMLTYGAGGEAHLIKTINDGTSTWNYSHSTNSNATVPEIDLDTITLPDSSQWKLAGLRSMNYDVKPLDPTRCGVPTSVVETTLIGSLLHPSGATASFTMNPVRHFRADTPNTCQIGYPHTNTTHNYFYTNSLTSKTISGPGIADMTWTYGGAASTEGKGILQTDPANVQTRFTFGNRFGIDEGKPLRVDYGWDGTAALRSVVTRYRQTAGPYPVEFGVTDRYMGDAGTNIKNMPVDQRQTTQQGMSFLWAADAFDGLMRPTNVTRSSYLGAKAEVTTYDDNLGKWVVGQIKTITVDGKKPVENFYNPTTANLETVTKFGKLQKTLAYYTDGTLFTSKDGKGQTTTNSSYKRGVPQKIVYADTTSESAVVNNDGSIASTTDPSGATTSYGYDAMGRLASVTYPTADTVLWNKTTITTAKIGVAEYDIGAGHWRQVITTGNAAKTIYFDALLRPVYTETRDLADVAGTRRMTKHQYDFAGRVKFEAYPKRNQAELTSGKYHDYDALGRPTVTGTESELGMLWSGFSYGTGFQTTQTNNRGINTVFSYQAFDEPSDAAITRIVAPEGVTVTIARNTLGMPLSVNRAGAGKSATRSYVYDGFMRLCKTIEPETGATVQDYDLANNVAWRASGLALPSTTTCDTASVVAAKKLTFGYDPKNQLTSTTFGDASPAIGRTYTADGLPATITSNGSVWTNTYNKRRLNERESLAYAGATYSIDRLYDTNGSLSRLTYPRDNLALLYNPNALGEARQVGAYASEITYHPNGAVARFKYGNGIVHTTSQNARGLPYQSADVGVINDIYTYDGNANPVGIADQLPPSTTNRAMVYDNLDRVTLARAPALWGDAWYGYDALDNIVTSALTAGGTMRTMTHNNDAATNRLGSITGTAGYSFNYGYDSQGNITQRGTQAYVFDIGNRMKQATGKATYAYDGLGHRFSVVGLDGVNRIQVYTQGGQLLYTGQAGAAVTSGTKYVHLNRHMIAEVNSVSTKYSHTDGSGSPVAQTETTGAVASRTRYEPYGHVAAGPAKTIGFTGHVNDIDTGLTYMQQRYYDPIAGRMMSIDPVLTEANTGANFSRYAYANNSPYKYIYPDGRLPILPILIFVGKEIAGEAFERATGIPAPTLKNAGQTAVKIVAKNGVEIKSVAKHAVDRAIGDGGKRAPVSPEAILDSLKNPLKISDTKVDDLGRESQRFVGKDATTAVNPQTGKIVSVNPTSSKTAEKLQKAAEKND